MTRTAKTLRRVLEREFDSYSSAAEVTGIARPTISLDVGGQRGITAKRLASYLEHLTLRGRREILRAHLMDIVPDDLHEDLLFGGGDRVREDLPVFDPPASLSPELRSAIEWLAAELAKDDRLAAPFFLIAERFGWEKPDPGKADYRE